VGKKTNSSKKSGKTLSRPAGGTKVKEGPNAQTRQNQPVGGAPAPGASKPEGANASEGSLTQAGEMIAKDDKVFSRIRSASRHPGVAGYEAAKFGVTELAKNQDSVIDAGIASQAHEDLSGRGQSAASVHAQLGTQSDAFHRDLESIRGGKNSAAAKFESQSKEQHLDEELEDEAIGADLDKDLAEIDTGEMTEAQKIQARSKVTKKARRRKGEGSLKKLQQDAENAKSAAKSAGIEGKSAAEAADGMQSEVERRELMARKAAEEAGTVDGANAGQRKENSELIEFVKLLKQNKGNSLYNALGKAGTAALSFFSDKAGYKKLKERFGDVSTDARLEEIEKDLSDENKGFDHTKQMAEENAAQKRRMADDVQARQQKLRQTAKQAEATRVAAEELAKEKSGEYEKRKSAWDSNESKRAAAEELRVKRAVREAEARERNKFKGDGIQPSAPSAGAATGAQSESVTNAGAAVADALSQNTQIIVGTLTTLLEVLQKQNASISALQADIVKISAGTRGTLRTS
jgi:hypothetical protein